MNEKIAIVRIRGKIKVKKEIEDTMKMLRLFRTNSCVIVKNTSTTIGMIKKIKDYVTWGEVDEKTIKELLLKRGKLPGNKKLTEDYIKEKTKMNAADFVKAFIEDKKQLKDIPGLKLFFRLNPPLKGFERAGIKKTFAEGGVLGYRKEKINDMIIRMI